MVNLKHYSSNDLFLLDQFTPCTNIIVGQSKSVLTYTWSGHRNYVNLLPGSNLKFLEIFKYITQVLNCVWMMYQEGCVQFADFKEFVHSIICWKGSNFLSCFYCVFLRTGWSLRVWKEGFDKQIRIDILQIKIIAFKSWKTNISIRVLIIEGNSEASKLNIEAFTAYFMRALLLAQ